MTASTESSSPVERARALRPLVAASSDAIESGRRLPDEVASALKAAGLFRLCVPRRYAGLEATPLEMIETIAEIAAADGSAGWCVAIGATSGLLSGWLDDAEAREIFASDPLGVAGGVFAPRGQALADGDSYLVSGRWPFASGIDHCSWLMGGCIVVEDGKPAMLPNGLPDSRLLIFPKAQATVHDTWNVSGLCGTGSHDMEVSSIRVPRSRAISLMTDRPKSELALFQFPVFGCLAIGIASVTLGLARRAIDELAGLAGGKVATGSRRRVADRAFVQMQVAEAEAAQRGAHAFLVDTVGATYEEARRHGEISVRQRALLRLAATSCVAQSKKAVDLMHDAGGGSSIYRSSPLQRCLRDVHTASQHMMVSSSTLELAGRVLLGLETDAWQL